ncbi:MAG TPA: diguanylate cyclase [Anaerolineales bacterium]
MDKPFALIIEDERDIVALFRHVLDLAGYHTEIVLDGKAAMDYLSRATPDIVLLDLGLPNLSGSEILVRMNADERLKKIPVVVITAFPHAAEALPVTPQLILIKPVNIEQMSTLIQRICPTEKATETLPWDVLTNVYNRSFFMARLGYALERSRQLRENKFAVLYLDLGQSSKINFLFGKEYQRRVLQESAAVLKTLVRSTDTIARLGGDVFVVLIEDVTNPEVPILVASRVQSRIRKHLEKSEDELQVRANVGIVLCGQEYHSVEDILRDAEASLEMAKQDRKKMLQTLREKSVNGGASLHTSSYMH